MESPSSRRAGFTLVELLVVIAIIGVLVALLLPAIQMARDAARRSQCSNNAKQIGIALHNYHDTFKAFPAGAWSFDSAGVKDDSCTSTRGRRAPWSVLILPFMELQALYDQVQLTREFVSSNAESPTTGPNSPNRDVWATRVATYQCPSFPARSIPNNHSNYFGVMGGGPYAMGYCQSNDPGRRFYNNGILFQNSSTRFSDISDGVANTFIVGEQRYQLMEKGRSDAHWLGWASTNRGGTTAVTGTLAAGQIQINIFDGHGNRYDTAFGSGTPPVPQGHGLHQRTFGSYHPGGCHFVMADATVRFVSENIDLATYHYLCIVSDGQVVSVP